MSGGYYRCVTNRNCNSVNLFIVIGHKTTIICNYLHRSEIVYNSRFKIKS